MYKVLIINAFYKMTKNDAININMQGYSKLDDKGTL